MGWASRQHGERSISKSTLRADESPCAQVNYLMNESSFWRGIKVTLFSAVVNKYDKKLNDRLRDGSYTDES